MRYVRVVAKNFNRLAPGVPPALMDRAAAGLVKETDIEDVNLRLQNLKNLEGVDHALLKKLAERLSQQRGRIHRSPGKEKPRDPEPSALMAR